MVLLAGLQWIELQFARCAKSRRKPAGVDVAAASNESVKLPELGRPRLQVTGHGPYCAEHTGC